MAHGLLQALDLLSIGVVVLHLPDAVVVEKNDINMLYIDKRIATLGLLTQRHKLESQFPYL